jgi:hypothetical protein
MALDLADGGQAVGGQTGAHSTVSQRLGGQPVPDATVSTIPVYWRLGMAVARRSPEEAEADDEPSPCGFSTVFG